MDRRAVAKARTRLDQARDKLREAEAAQDYGTFSAAWYFFLIAAKNVYTCLEQGSKVTPQSRQWFGAKKNERRNDPLLQYLFQTRDDDEHGLGDVTELQGERFAIGKADPGFSKEVSIHMTTDEHGRPTFHRLEGRDGLPVLVEHTPAHAILLPVTGRGGVVYNPPKRHMGNALPDSLPLTVGNTGLSYLAQLVSEAHARAAN